MTPSQSVKHPVTRDRIWQLLGKSARETSFINCERQSATIDGSMRIEKLVFTSSTGDTVPALFVSPISPIGPTHKAPAILYWLAALDERVRAAVSLCCFAALDYLIDTGQHEGGGHYVTVRGLLEITSSEHLAGLAAHRAQIFGVRLQDRSTSGDCFQRSRTQLQDVYKQQNAQDQLIFHIESETGHTETQVMQSQVLVQNTTQPEHPEFRTMASWC